MCNALPPEATTRSANPRVERIFMSTSEARVVEQVVDTARYPLTRPAGADWQAVVSRIRQELREHGCSVLPNFVRPASCDTLRREGVTIAPLAYYDVETVNV